mgnify:FL=1
MLEHDEGLSRDTATWLAALAAFVQPQERQHCFDAGDSLLPVCRQLSVAVGEGIVDLQPQRFMRSFH